MAASHAWPSAGSDVVEARLEERTTTRGGTEYWPRVVYRYRVGDRTLRGQRLHFGESIAYNVRSHAERRLAALAAEAAVRVFYDPVDPAQAVVERSAPVLRRDTVMMAILAGILLALFLAAPAWSP